MDYVQNNDLTQTILSNANIGLWAVEIDEGAAPRMLADKTMMALLGIEDDKSPEEIYTFWISKIDSGYMDMVKDYVAKMSQGIHAEIQYQWFHPTKGLVYVRCGGVRNYTYTKGIRLEGCHQDVSELVHVEKGFTLTHDILADANIGLWDIELDEGCEPRMHIDSTMKKLLGITKDLTPEETYHAWYDHVHPSQYENVNDAVDKMTNGLHAEVQYPFIHPTEGLTYVRCGGVRNFAYKNGIRLEGCHQDVTQLIHIQMEMSDMKMKLAMAENMAILDSMTHVYNHEGFKTKAQELIDKNKERGILTFIMFADMDRLKQINDTYGHDDGDFCLKELADILASAVGDRGFIGRLGGDEFAMVASYREPNDEGKHFYDSINYLINEFNKKSSKPYKLSASLGGIMICPGDTFTLEEALNAADTKMYEQKQLHHLGK